MMKKYKDDYQTVVTTDDKGREKKKTVYSGEYFQVSPGDQDLSEYKRKVLLLVVLITLLQVAAGFLNNPGMFQFYIALPYVVAFYPIYNLVTGILRIPNEPREFRRDEIDHSFIRVKNASIVLMVLLGIVLLGDIGFLLFGGAGDEIALEFLFLAVEMIAALAAWFVVASSRVVKIHGGMQK